MTLTRLTRQRKDVRNVKCKEEEEWYYLFAYSSVCLAEMLNHTMLRQIFI
jgi:hypothetical protein